MASISFAVPIVKGKTDTWKRAVAEMKGARSNEYRASRKRAGLTRELACLQSTPMGDFVVVTLEGADPLASLKKMIESKEPFDQWFAKTVMVESHGMKPGDPMPSSQSMLEYRG